MTDKPVASELYIQQAERLTRLAIQVTDPAMRLELLEIAAGFQKLAQYAATNRNAGEIATDTEPKSA
ncbi:MAG TPA: hypothetical protein VGL83_18985 [Stellaceae bacterium]|jgi:methylphosphotriester-DNA--protein-cysteine methyltransferase